MIEKGIQPMNEQRKAERIATDRPVQMTSPALDVKGKMIDLSIKGCGVLSQNEIKTGDNITLNFHLPSAGTTDIKIDGVASHTQAVRKEYLIGVEFVDLPDHLDNVISEYIHYHHRLD